MTSLNDDVDLLLLEVLPVSVKDFVIKDAEVSWKEERAWYASDFCCAMNCCFSFASSSFLDLTWRDRDECNGGCWIDGRFNPLLFRMV